MGPESIAALDAPLLAQLAPECGCFAQGAWPHLESDKGGEGALRRTACGATSAHRLSESLSRRQRRGTGLRHDVVDPALDECEEGLESAEGCLLLLLLGEREEIGPHQLP